MSLRISIAGKTDRGLVRSGNEDSFLIDTENNLVLVCDGMGGHQAGEVASRDACDIVNYSFTQIANALKEDAVLSLPAALPPLGDLLIKAIRLANRSIYFRSRSRSHLSGMGTTIVGAVIENGIINIAHVGDSRAYRLSPAGLVPLTTDHSWVAELKQSGQFSEAEAAMMVGKNVITRALGVNEKVEIDYRADRISPGEIFILCTDGLSAYADDADIFAAIKDCRDDINGIVENLVRLANDRGGQDNVTIAAIRVDEVASENIQPAVPPVTVGVESDEALLRENEIIGSIIQQEEKTEQFRIEDGETADKKRPLVWIFAIFVVIAAIIIIITTGK